MHDFVIYFSKNKHCSGFHTLMSFLGSIGTLMAGTGLKDVFSEIYAENSVTHMLSGKAIARAIRAHILTASALWSCLLEIVKEENSKIDFSQFDSFYQKACQGELTDQMLDELALSNAVKEIEDAISVTKSDLKKQSRTCELWLTYLEYISIVKEFIYAERTSNWELHLNVLSKMLNLFAATGHIHYGKSSRVYLQEMKKLPEKHPLVYAEFMKGSHTVQRTKRNWTGIWTDLAIEQTLMRSIKSRGGLTGGRGMTENVRHVWTCHWRCSKIE